MLISQIHSLDIQAQEFANRQTGVLLSDPGRMHSGPMSFADYLERSAPTPRAERTPDPYTTAAATSYSRPHESSAPAHTRKADEADEASVKTAKAADTTAPKPPRAADENRRTEDTASASDDRAELADADRKSGAAGKSAEESAARSAEQDRRSADEHPGPKHDTSADAPAGRDGSRASLAGSGAISSATVAEAAGEAAATNSAASDAAPKRFHRDSVRAADGHIAAKRRVVKNGEAADRSAGRKSGIATISVATRSETRVDIDVTLATEGRGAKAAKPSGIDGEGQRTKLESALAQTDGEQAAARAAAAHDLPGDAARRRESDGPEPTSRRESGEASKLEVRDLRSRGASGDEGGRHGQPDSQPDSEAKRSLISREFTSETRSSADAQGSIEALRTEHGPGSPTTARSTARLTPQAAETLRQSLRDQVNGEIVRSARFVVRGNESGEIRLHLRPENLGSVRISLQMQDGHIAGRIIVDNQSVRDVFEQNMSALQRAFAENGLEASGLEVSVADSGTQGRGGEQSSSAGRGGRAATAFSAVVPDVGLIDEDHDLVDMVV